MTPAELADSAERSLIGALIADSSVTDRVTGIVHPEDFSTAEGRSCYTAVWNLHDAGQTITAESLVRTAGGRPQAYIARCISAGVPQSVESYAREIREIALWRSLKGLADTFPARLQACDSVDVRGVADWLVSRVESLMQGRGEQAAKPIGHFVRQSLERISESIDRERTMGTPVGLEDVDRTVGGLFPGELTTIAARPGLGKTALLLQIARHMASAQRQRAVVFSLEMTGEELATRGMCSLAQVSASRVRAGGTSRADFARLTQAGDQLGAMDLHVDDDSGTTIKRIAAVCRMLASEGKLGLIGVDYLGLVKPSSYSRGRSRTEQVSETCKALKALAKQMECPVVALSQVNREAAKEGWLRLHHLSESGSIEQDSNAVWFIQQRDESSFGETVTKHYIEVAKNRSGPTGSIEVKWKPEWTTFADMSAADMDNYKSEFSEWT